MIIAPPPPHLAHLQQAIIVPPPPNLRHLGAVGGPPPVAKPIPPFARLPIVACDTECYRNFWMIKFMDRATRRVIDRVDMYPGKSLDVNAIAQIMTAHTSVTFNGIHYDIPMITAAMSGMDCAQLKALNNMIIPGAGHKGLQSWEVYRQFGLVDPLNTRAWIDGKLETVEPLIDHIDLKEVAPGVMISLKTYGGRLGSKRIQDLPIAPEDDISPAQREQLSIYCDNDLETTLDLLNDVERRLVLRSAQGDKYGIDLRSKSDAQMAEAIIKSQIGFDVQKPVFLHGTKFQYQVPDFISFVTPSMQAVLQMVRDAVFITSDKDQCDELIDEITGEKIKTGVIIPKEIKNARPRIGASVYKMGIGGLHSMESGVYHLSAPGVTTITVADVTSYYPWIIINCNYYPPQIGPRFIEIFRSIVEGRIIAKNQAGELVSKADMIDALAQTPSSFFEAQDMARAMRDQSISFQVEADGLKIVINGTFGKLGSKWSIFFAPPLLIQTTITGQLSLFMLIEWLEQAGIAVVSANTDGIVIKCPAGMEWIRDDILQKWMGRTKFNLESVEYKALYSRDVNNYIAIKADGKTTTKGVFAKAGVQKNPTNSICVEAITAYLTKGALPAETIRACTDVRKFLTVRNVKGGGVKNGQYLGKVVRWYYGKGEHGAITYLSNGNLVAKSEGAIPMMQLSDTFPVDLDYDWYIRECYAMLIGVGLR